MNTLNFEVISYANDKFAPHSVVRRNSEGYYEDTFTIGDYVSNGTQMKGHIEKFTLSSDLKDLYVFTDWSGVGMNLDSIFKIPELPSHFQINDLCEINLNDSGSLKNCKVIAVHFTKSKVKYDFEITSHCANLPKIGEKILSYNEETFTTRIYNVDSCFVHNG